MSADAVRHRLYDLLGTRVPHLVVDETLDAAWEYRPFRRLLTLGRTDPGTVLDAAALVYLAATADLGKGPCRAVPEGLQERHARIQRNLATFGLSGKAVQS
jgi:hypothetical protein